MRYRIPPAFMTWRRRLPSAMLALLVAAISFGGTSVTLQGNAQASSSAAPAAAVPVPRLVRSGGKTIASLAPVHVDTAIQAKRFERCGGAVIYSSRDGLPATKESVPFMQTERMPDGSMAVTALRYSEANGGFKLSLGYADGITTINLNDLRDRRRIAEGGSGYFQIIPAHIRVAIDGAYHFDPASPSSVAAKQKNGRRVAAAGQAGISAALPAYTISPKHAQKPITAEDHQRARAMLEKLHAIVSAAVAKGCFEVPVASATRLQAPRLDQAMQKKQRARAETRPSGPRQHPLPWADRVLFGQY